MMEKDPEYIVYFTYLDSDIFLNIIRWSDRALLEIRIGICSIKRLTKNFISKLDGELINSSLSTDGGFMDPAEIVWRDDIYSEETAFALYMSTDLGKLKKVLKKLDPGKLIDLYYVY